MGSRNDISPRTIARRSRRETGTTPHRWLKNQRLLTAQWRLATTAEPIEAIAEAVGLQTAAALRLHLRRSLRMTPTLCRRRFAVNGPGAA